MVKAPCGRGRARMGASYQSLPTGETKPKTMWSCMCFPLPNLTNISARDAKPIGAFGSVQEPLPFPTNRPLWLHHRSHVVLPIITSRGVKYTHNDIKHLVLHPDSGPPGIRPIPPEHPPKKVVMRDPYVIAINRTPQRIDAVFRFMIRWLIIANIVLGLFTIFNIYIYPKYIYERPEPVLISEPVDQLLPYEV